jgi:micrococcal nuclease
MHPAANQHARVFRELSLRADNVPAVRVTGLLALLLVVSCQTVPAPARALTDLVQAAPGGDGDSWKDTRGRAYRLGMVNAPELSECYGARAASERKRLVRDGFRAEVYATDRYARSVAVVTLPDGTNVNVLLARQGYVDDRYLKGFRHENRALAAELDRAFAAARKERAGLWGACPAAR